VWRRGIPVQHEGRHGVQRIEQKVRVQLAAQRVETGFPGLVLGPKQSFSFLCRLLPVFDTEIETAPEEQNHGKIQGINRPITPRKLLKREHELVKQKACDYAHQNRPSESANLQGQPR
jgi:hypothetical protein